MILTAENYHSLEANKAYMGNSQVKDFMKCEAQTMAKINGEYEEETTTALLVGSYVDAHFEGTLDIFKAHHPEILKKNGELKADYEHANYIIERIERDDLFSRLMAGKKQVIMTGEIASVDFKIKIDSLLSPEQVQGIVRKYPNTADVFGEVGLKYGAIVDLKTAKDTNDVYKDGMYQNFVQAWGYDIQGAIYQHVASGHIKAKVPFILAVATKEKEPELIALHIPDNELAAKLEEIKEIVGHMHWLKHGPKAYPARCEKCNYCRKTKVLSEIVDFREVGF